MPDPAPSPQPGSLHWRFWLGTVDARPLAAFRVGFGMLLLYDLAARARDFMAFYTDAGILPRAEVAGLDPGRWSLLWLTGEPALVMAICVVGALATIAFTLGWRTRIATFLVWAFFSSLQNRNLAVCDGGDDMARALLFWSLFADLGACFSLDARSPWRAAARVPALGQRLLEAQLAIAYVMAAKAKLHGAWGDGSAIYQVLQHVGFLRPLGAILAEHPLLCRILTHATVGIEALIPLLIFSPIRPRLTRTLAALLGVGLQLGILVTMRVGIFTGVMIWLCILLAPASLFERLRLRGPAEAGTPKWWRRVWPLLGVAHLVALVAMQIAPQRLRDEVGLELRMVGLDQGWGMFVPPPPIQTWEARGRFADGTERDVLPEVAPRMIPHVGVRHSRWYKLSIKSGLQPEPLAQWICRAYPGAGELLEVTLIRRVHPPARPGEAPAPDTVSDAAKVRCREK